MLLSDRDIREQLETGRVGLEPLDLGMIQPSSIDVRLDKYFRLFDNHKYPFIDPREDQPELTRLVEIQDGEPFILHPGEFVLGSTSERVRLPPPQSGGRRTIGRARRARALSMSKQMLVAMRNNQVRRLARPSNRFQKKISS